MGIQCNLLATSDLQTLNFVNIEEPESSEEDKCEQSLVPLNDNKKADPDFDPDHESTCSSDDDRYTLYFKITYTLTFTVYFDILHLTLYEYLIMHIICIVCFSSIDDDGPKVTVLQRRKYIIYEDNLMELFRKCPNCAADTLSEINCTRGTMVKISQECGSCDTRRTWFSQPMVGSIPAGNLALSSAILFSGTYLMVIKSDFVHIILIFRFDIHVHHLSIVPFHTCTSVHMCEKC